MDICHIMTVSAFAKDKLGKSPSLNCFSSYLFHGRRRLFPFQLFVLGILLSLSVKGRGSIVTMLQSASGAGVGMQGMNSWLPQRRIRGSSGPFCSFSPGLCCLCFLILAFPRLLVLFHLFFCLSFTCTVASGPFLGGLHPC